VEKETMDTEATADGKRESGDGITPETADPAAVPPLTAEAVADLKARAAKSDENWDRYLRLSADFENFKKRAARERTEATKSAQEGLLQKLIPVADNFDMAIAATQAPNVTASSLQAGISMIYSQFKSLLADSGLEEINALNQAFDPNLHEAVSEQATTEAAEGQVIQQIRKGYRLREKLIRPASVVVAKKPA
jgi:molecular chaperone GrpE